MELFFKKNPDFSCTPQQFDILLHRQNGRTTVLDTFGEVAEWSIAPVLKTDVLKGTGGSNPSLSAKSDLTRCKPTS